MVQALLTLPKVERYFCVGLLKIFSKCSKASGISLTYCTLVFVVSERVGLRSKLCAWLPLLCPSTTPPYVDSGALLTQSELRRQERH